MYKLSDILGDYQDPEPIETQDSLGRTPIKTPKKSTWSKKESPERLVKIFKFDSETKFNEFLIEILEYQTESGHHGRLTAQFPQIKLEVWTHTLNQLTELDFEWVKQVDIIHKGLQ